MVKYELRYFGAGGQWFAAHGFDADDDAAAIARASFLARLKAPAFEVWQGRRLIARLTTGSLSECA